MSKTLLRISNLKTRLGDAGNPVYAVDGVDIEVRKGEVFALLGESGCGKSMTALSAMRLLPPQAPLLRGRPIWGIPACSTYPKGRCAECAVAAWV